ncbi:MAG TPA: general secretion pathway protein GspE [Planctomycetaceae bacterium]|nr:general secretion pathway protein GspE [Planctomycetaceae bacterium]|tara:strand:- start:2209 stop:3891 length:1683 start_codon:yes stop_codon:yes gene_type:complete
MDIESVLQHRGLVTEDQWRDARAQAGGRRIDSVLVEMGLLSEEQALEAFADELGMEFIELGDFEVDTELVGQFPTAAIFRHEVLPLDRDNGRVRVATSDPFDLEALSELSSLSGLQLDPVLARHDDIVELIKTHLGVGGDTITELVARQADDGVELLEEIDDIDGDLADEAQAASVIRLVNELLIEALELNTTDLHIEPQEHGLRVRYRIDGMLRPQPVPPEINQFYSSIVTRLKIMSRLNIAERRLPQDGRIKLRIRGREIDVRVSIIPMIHGEAVVLRLLDKGRMVFDLVNVGLPDEIIAVFNELIELPHGIILVTGPTGCGKTTTLYSCLNELKSTTTKIITVEDPVEYQTEGINQIQVHSKIGLTFAHGLRSILRHDPDVILVGEIRDSETAEAAIQASLTGHLVFSTLHTNDAASAFTRLIDMGVEPFLASSTVEGVMAQRLVRRLCEECREPYTPEESEMPADFPRPLPEVLYRPVGCRACRETGFSGRTGIFELLRTDEGVRELCVERASSSRIRKHGLENGMTTLRQSGWEKVAAGITDVEEISRITKGDLV